MNSSAQPFARIASNRLWTPHGVLLNPLVTAAADGTLLAIETCAEPDREALTEFHAGMLVADFPRDYRAAFAQMCAQSALPLGELLPRFREAGGCLIVLSGLDYEALRLTPQSRIRRLLPLT